MTFDSQAVALIAYLQRIGTDIFAPPAPALPVPPAEAAAEQPESDAEPAEKSTVPTDNPEP